MKTYIIRAGESEFVKIGRAVHPEARLRELQTAHYEVLRVIRVIRGDAEKAFHVRFADVRVRGEWFKFTAEMMTFNPKADHSFEQNLKAYRRALAIANHGAAA